MSKNSSDFLFFLLMQYCPFKGLKKWRERHLIERATVNLGQLRVNVKTGETEGRVVTELGEKCESRQDGKWNRLWAED